MMFALLGWWGRWPFWPVQLASTSTGEALGCGHANVHLLVHRHRGFHRDGGAAGERVDGGAGRSSPADPGGLGAVKVKDLTARQVLESPGRAAGLAVAPPAPVASAQHGAYKIARPRGQLRWQPVVDRRRRGRGL